MGAPRKCPAGLRGRATRMAVQARRDPDGPKGAVKRVADEPGVHPEALRARVRRAETDAGGRAGTTSQDGEHQTAGEAGARAGAGRRDPAQDERVFRPGRSQAAGRGHRLLHP